MVAVAGDEERDHGGDKRDSHIFQRFIHQRWPPGRATVPLCSERDVAVLPGRAGALLRVHGCIFFISTSRYMHIDKEHPFIICMNHILSMF